MRTSSSLRPWVATAAIGLSLASATSCRGTAGSLFEEAHRAIQEDDHERAAHLFREFTIRAPDDPLAPRAHFELARIHYLHHRDIGAARDSLYKVITDYPESKVVLDARRLLARLYERDFQDPDKALSQYRWILTEQHRDEARRETLLSIANCLYRLNKLDESATAFRRALALAYHPDQDGAYLRLANLEWLSGSPDEALRLLRELASKTEDEDRRYEALERDVEVLMSLGRFSEARARLRKLESFFPEAGSVDELRARIHAVQRAHQSLEGEDQAVLLRELQKKIRWGAGRRRRRSNDTR